MNLIDRLHAGGLANDQVSLSVVAPQDALWLQSASADDEVVRWTDIPAPFTTAEADSWIAKRERGWAAGWRASFFVRDADSSPIGYLTLRIDWARSSADIGYWLLAAHRRRGLITAALRLVRDWAFDELELRRLQAEIQPENAQSVAVVTRLGFTMEGLLRSSDVLKGVRHDHLMFSLLDSDKRL